MKQKNISIPYKQFFALLAIPTIALLLTAFSEKAVMNNELPCETIADTITAKNMKMMIRDEAGYAESPLILVDGEEVPDIKGLKPEDIYSISVLKNDRATDLFASKGKNGVILITTKREKDLNSISKISQLDNSISFMNKVKIHCLDDSSNVPLILLDGEEVPMLKEINPADVKSISVLKNQSAISVFGEKGQNGVIIITTKGES